MEAQAANNPPQEGANNQNPPEQEVPNQQQPPPDYGLSMYGCPLDFVDTKSTCVAWRG